MMCDEERIINQKASRIIFISSLAVFFTLLLATVTFPNILWNKFFYKYFWAPVLADAGQWSSGIPAGYNSINTLTYSIILILSLLGIYLLFIRLKIRIENNFFLSLSPILIAGPLLRMLEDLDYFSIPARYVFISPFIYIFLGIVILFAIILNYLFYKNIKIYWERLLLSILLSLITPILFFLLSLKELVALGPIPFLITTLVLFIIFTLLGSIFKIRRWEGGLLLFTLSLFLTTLLPFLLLSPKKGEVILHLKMGSIAFGGAFVLTGIICLILKVLNIKWKGHHPPISGINIAIVFGHSLDSLATYFAVDYLSYSEKHVLPRFLFGLTGTAFVMVPIKIILILLVLYTLDVYLKKEKKEYPTLFSLLKLAILVVGLGPGMRDLSRAIIGV